jgi:type IV pilus assembly protein PilC
MPGRGSPIFRKWLAGRLPECNFKPIPLPDLIRWTASFHSLIRAGLPLLSCLRILAHFEHLHHTKVRNMTRTFLESVSNGLPLSTAMATSRLPPAMIRLIKIAEISGEMEHCLHLLVHWYKEQLQWRRTIKQILSYPVLLLVSASCLIAYISLFVLPQFASMYEMLGVPVSPVTKSVMVIVHYGVPVVFGIPLLITIAGIVYWLRIRKHDNVFYRWVLHIIQIPKIGPFLRLWISSVFADSCSILLKAGISISDALASLTEPDQPAIVRILAQTMLNRVLAGHSIVTLAQDLPFANDFHVMLELADQTGDLAACMELACDLMKREWTYQLEWFLQKLQPLVMVILGIIVCGITLLVMLPFYDVMARL